MDDLRVHFTFAMIFLKVQIERKAVMFLSSKGQIKLKQEPSRLVFIRIILLLLFIF